MGNSQPHEDVSYELPPVEEADDAIGIEDEDEDDILVMRDDEDPFDDACADDLPLDYVLSTTNEEGSAVGDERLGIEDAAPDDVLAIDEGGDSSFLDDGKPDNAMGVDSDDELGLDALPGDLDDGGLEGPEDAAGERVDELAFPPLDGDEDDDDYELDVGVHIEENLND